MISSLQLYTLVFFTFFALTDLYSVEQVKSYFGQAHNAGNTGTDFWFSVPSGEFNPTQDSVYISISSAYKAEFKIELLANGTNITGKTDGFARQTVIGLPINQAVLQPYAEGDVFKQSKVFRNSAIRLSSDQPVNLKVFVKSQGGAESFTPYPVAFSGFEYFINSPYAGVANPNAAQTTCIVAPFDDTDLNITIGGNSQSSIILENNAAYNLGQTLSIRLMKGDVFVLSNRANNAGLAGTNISSNNPITVTNGTLKVTASGKNLALENVLPAGAGANTFLIPDFLGMEASTSYASIFSQNAACQISYSNGESGLLSGTSGLVGERYLNKNYFAPMAFVTNAPALATMLYDFGTGSHTSFTNIIPLEQFQQSIIFSVEAGTAASELAIIFKRNTNLKLVRYDNNGNEVNVPLNLNSAKNYAGNPIYTDYSCLSEIVQAGLYKLSSDTGLMGYLLEKYDGGTAVCPVGFELKDLRLIDNIAPLPNYVQSCDGRIDGAARDNPGNNLAEIIFHKDLSTNYQVTLNTLYSPFRPGLTTSVSWRLNVTKTNEDAVAYISFIDRSGNDTTIKIEYFAPKHFIENQNENYGQFNIGDNSTKDFFIVNSNPTPLLVKNLRLRYNNAGFSILPLEWNIADAIESGGRRKVSVRFDATRVGNFTDEIGFDDECKLAFYSIARASVGASNIGVDDIDFGQQGVMTTSNEISVLKNTGAGVLVITAVSGPTNPVFASNNLNTIIGNLPYNLNSNSSFDINFSFTPTDDMRYLDSVVFETVSEGKNIIYLSGQGTKSELIANNINFGKLRIDNGKNVVNPKTQTLRIVNNGSADAVISGSAVTNSDGDFNSILFDTDKTIFDFNNLFIGRPIYANSSLEIEFSFLPTAVGYHTLEVEIYTESRDTIFTRLSGIGTDPILQTSNIDFGTATSINEADAINATFEITNLACEFCDEANLINFNFLPADISSDFAIYATNTGFKFDINDNPLNNPITLPEGSTLQFKARFRPNAPGVFTAIITSVSDATNEVNSTWTGQYFSSELRAELSNSNIKLCPGNETIVFIDFSSIGNADLEITNIEIDAQDITSEISETNFTLSSGSTKSIELKLSTMQNFNNRQVRITITLSDGTSYNLTAIASSEINDIKTTASFSNEGIEPNKEKVKLVGTLHFDQDVVALNPNRLKVRVQFVNNFIYYDNASIQLTPVFALAWALVPMSEQFTIIDPNLRLAELEFELERIDLGVQLQVYEGLAFSIDFTSYFPSNLNNANGLVSTAEIFANQDNLCLESLTRIEDSIDMLGVCAPSYRFIEVSNNGYYLNIQKDSELILCDYGIGLDGTYTLNLLDINSRVIDQIKVENAQSGVYQAGFTAALNSGVYFIHLDAGIYQTMEKILIIE